MPPGNSFLRLVIGWGARWLTMMDSLFTELKQGCEKMWGERVFLQARRWGCPYFSFVVCVLACLISLWFVCLFSCLIHLVFLWFSPCLRWLCRQLVCVHIFLSSCRCFSLFSLIFLKRSLFFDPSYFICFLWSNVTSKALLSFPALDRNLIFDTFGIHLWFYIWHGWPVCSCGCTLIWMKKSPDRPCEKYM